MPTTPFNVWALGRGQQPTPVSGGGGEAGAAASLTAGLSFLPALFGLNLTVQHGAQGEPNAELSPEQAQQAYLSRLLLLLGSMVILCLLLF